MEKDAFLANLSHELRNPLGAIVGYADMLKEEKAPDENLLREAVDVIARNGEVALQLVNDLLDIARIGSGKLSVEMQQVRIDSVVHAALATVQLMARGKKIELRSNVPDVGRVLGDPGRVQQIIWNLLSNAIKFTPEGGTIDVRLERQNQNVVVTVKDSGKGISADFLPYAFDKFAQQDPHAARLQGEVFPIFALTLNRRSIFDG